MKYEKAEARVVEFETEDVIVTSGETEETCGFDFFNAAHCDGVTQMVTNKVQDATNKV